MPSRPHENERKRAAVPKFSSFRPKPASPHNKVEKADESTPSRRDSQRIAKESHSRARDRHDSAASAPRKPHVGLSPRPSPYPAESAPYVVDKRGDALIRRYGSNDRRQIPEYRRIGAGRLLGIDGFMSIDRSGAREEFFIRSFHESSSLLSSDRKRLLAKGIRLGSQPVRLRRRNSNAAIGNEDYLSLRPAKKRKRDASSEPLSSGDEGPSYRSIHGKSKYHEHSDSDEQFSSGSSGDEVGRDVTDPATVKTIDLTRAAREHPEDISAWLRLVDHQNDLMQIQAGAGVPTAAEAKSFADVKLSLLEQALAHANEDPQRESLHLKIMHEGTKVWDPKTAEKRWQVVLQKYPASFTAWKAYMDFRQTTLSTFRYDEIKCLYVDRLRAMSADIAGASPSQDLIQRCEHMIYVFARLAGFLAESGFVELATAIWQATLEITFSRPPISDQLLEAELTSKFQEFWESEVPRIGDHGARGWAAFETEDSAQEPPDPKSSIADRPSTTRDPFKAWSMIEQCRAENATMPARTLDDGAEDDPFRVVMSADLQGLLLCLPANVIPEIRLQLIDAFLLFLQLPPAFCTSTLIREMMRDEFLIRSAQRDAIIEVYSTNQEHESLQNSDGQGRRSPLLTQGYQHMAMTTAALFPSSRWFTSMRSVRADIPRDRYLFVSTAIKQLTQAFGVKELAPYCLAFESKNEPGNEKKTAKALLRQNPTNIDLYLGYSSLEWERSDKAAALNVLTAARNLPALTASDRGRLLIAATWMDLEDLALTQAAMRLCCLAEDGFPAQTATKPEDRPVSTLEILKSRQRLASNRDYLLSSGDLTGSTIWAEALALLEYLTGSSGTEPSSDKQGDIWAAMSSISTASDDIVSRGYSDSPEHEQLLQSAARLLYHHATHGVFRPAFFREQLTKYIHLFPDNTIFLALFAWREDRLAGLDDRVRTLLDTVVLRPRRPRLGSHVFAIRHELLRVGNAHSARAAIERALACWEHHPGLWAAYVGLLCSGSGAGAAPPRHRSFPGPELRSRAREVYYRAIQRCPGSRAVFMQAFDLDLDFDEAELRSVYATMCDKGLRVHVDMDEFVERWRSGEREREREAKERKSTTAAVKAVAQGRRARP